MTNTLKETPSHVQFAIVGGGPAGLMAAEALIDHGAHVHIFDAMPSLGRKFLMAGKSGLNLTHDEPFKLFLGRFGVSREHLEPALTDFKPGAIRAWAYELGVETFVGTSGRVFPKDFKAAPLLRAWLHRLRDRGATIHVRHKWTGWAQDETDATLHFETPDGTALVHADATVLALGGASWPKLGSDGAWVTPLHDKGVEIAALRPANCGFDVAWSDYLKEHFAGAPLKSVRLSFGDQAVPGDAVVTQTGLEGGPVYTLSAALRDTLEREGQAVLTVDLSPGRSLAELTEALNRPRGKKSMATHLKRTVRISGVKAALLREYLPADAFDDTAHLAAGIKALPIPLIATRPLEEAISTAGGVKLDAVDEGYMLKALPGVFCAGEMLDWEAPTGGYLLSACLATGRSAGDGAFYWITQRLDAGLDPQVAALLDPK
ncbi:TIGR03862 family flavoprotein [Magnetovibrio sp.]|uniref:TIGR03862 family flavoprotein n=1 Tax=Magnetovibrio sp. TaxID=2024836 RepID=UPI002F933E51